MTETGAGEACFIEWCESVVTMVRKGKGFCSENCYHTNWRIETGRLILLDPITCPLESCAKTFRPRKKTQRYCSPACREGHGKSKTSAGVTVRTARTSAASRERGTRRAKQWVDENPERARQHQRNRALRDRGISPEGFDALNSFFYGACWICHTISAEKTRGGNIRHLHVDHDHCHEADDPEGIRGLLDTGCNTRLAIVENTDLVARIEDYLTARSAYLPPPVEDDGRRNHNRFFRHGITEAQYEAMVEQCGGLCEVCHKADAYRNGENRPLSVDHDHAKAKGEPGFLRGLVCNVCNTAIGAVENRAWMELARGYLSWAPPLAQELLGGVEADRISPE